MGSSEGHNLENIPSLEEIPERLDEQHVFTTRTFGFLIHPSIPLTSPTLKIADVGTGTGIWLLDVAKTLPKTCQFTGFDMTPSAFPAPEKVPSNVSFKLQDMNQPFPASETGSYDIVAVRFVSVATPRSEWARSIASVVTLLKPGGWLQWIDSSNFTLYNTVPGTSRAACQEIFDGLEPFRSADAVIGMMMREPRNMQREDIFRGVGLLNVHEDVFSSDRLQDPELGLRDKGTRNAIVCFLGCLENLVDVDGSGWSKERIDKLKENSMKEIDNGVYHTIDQVCIIGQKAGNP